MGKSTIHGSYGKHDKPRDVFPISFTRNSQIPNYLRCPRSNSWASCFWGLLGYIFFLRHWCTHTMYSQKCKHILYVQMYHHTVCDIYYDMIWYKCIYIYYDNNIEKNKLFRSLSVCNRDLQELHPHRWYLTLYINICIYIFITCNVTCV